LGGDAELLRDDLGEDRQRPLPGFNSAREERGRAVLVDLHNRGARVGRNGEPDRVPHARHAASAPLHAFAPFQPNRCAASRSDSRTTTLCSVWLVGLNDPSFSAFRNLISSGSMPRAFAMSSMCDSYPKHTCGAPNPRIAPVIVLLV